ncbi:MAG: transcription elongation factor GreA [Bacilli bacterium]|nr:transcription elongation factor GreA [Bacilli bacterium]MDD4733779.1 transcription elongation factor GreA [Bacilli bacterium]
MSNTKEIYLTKEGLSELQQELDELKQIRRPEVINALKEARSLGDLSENAEYDAARNEQAMVENRIQEIEYLIENAILIAPQAKDVVSIGSSVTIEYVEEADTEVYLIVGSQEADPFENKISFESPLAKAILGKKVGQIGVVESENGKYSVKVVKIA